MHPPSWGWGWGAQTENIQIIHFQPKINFVVSVQSNASGQSYSSDKYFSFNPNRASFPPLEHEISSSLEEDPTSQLPPAPSRYPSSPSPRTGLDSHATIEEHCRVSGCDVTGILPTLDHHGYPSVMTSSCVPAIDHLASSLWLGSPDGR